MATVWFNGTSIDEAIAGVTLLRHGTPARGGRLHGDQGDPGGRVFRLGEHLARAAGPCAAVKRFPLPYDDAAIASAVTGTAFTQRPDGCPPAPHRHPWQCCGRR